ncbi:hypothetical protein AAON49_12830 [Pseudotenacibaculum sp. MALMAid0570]
MAVPYVFTIGEPIVFQQDYYAKRIMTLLSFPFFGWVFFELLRREKLKLKNWVIFYLFIYAIVFILSIIRGNKLTLIITDAFIALLPIFFYVLVFKTSVSLESYKNNFKTFVFLAVFLVLFGVKLQFSYFTLIAIAYILFYVKWMPQNIILFALVPIIAYQSLIGKSAFLMLLFVIGYLFFFDSKNISKKKKVYLLLIPSVIFTIAAFIFWDKIQGTGAYKNFVYFLRHADFSNLTFQDHSTSHRLYEASVVKENFANNNILYKLFGNGFGSTIDLSGTSDMTIARSNSDIHNVRNIHMGFFAVLSRYGIIGLTIYLGFVIKMLLVCFKTLKRENHYSITLGCLYILILLFDSFISFPHMMSNFLFWFTVAIVLYDRKKQKMNYK